MMERLIGAATIANLKTRILPAGLRDMQDWTGVTVTFRRRGGTGWVDVGTPVPAISIRLDNGQPIEALGSVETTVQGTLKVWLADVTAAMPQPGDRFAWHGHVCEIKVVAPARLDVYVPIEFVLLEGN